jgi:hypothetical protein
MPIDYEVDPGRGLVRVRMSGQVSVEDVRAYRMALESDPAVLPRFGRTIDVREVEHLLSPAEIRRLADLARMMEGMHAGARRALIVTRSDARQVLEVFVAYTSGGPSEYRMFRDPEEAERWVARE